MYLDQNLESGAARAPDSSEKESDKKIDEHFITRAEFIAKTSGIELENSNGKLDPRVALYCVLRADTSRDDPHHYNRMEDQRLFAEVLRMLGDTESLKKLMDAHPNIFRSESAEGYPR